MPQDLHPIPNSPPRRALTLDVERYQRMLDTADMTEGDKAEVIKALWNLVVCFMDLEYEILPLENCGKDGEQAKAVNPECWSVLSSEGIPIENDFARAANAIDKEVS